MTSAASAVYTAEIWNPATGTWTTGAAAAVERVYHSTTLLLPNGTVLSAGGGAPGPVSNQNAEIYYPPYLFRSVNGVASLAPRPVVTGVNALAFGHGGALRLELASGQLARRLVLVRTGTVTHVFNNSQRFIELPFTLTGDIVEATLPANPNLAPPGTYQKAVLDAAGVPSMAVLVSLGLSGSTPAPASGATAPAGTPLTISANPADVDGYTTRVEFYDGTKLIGTRTAQPWSLNWATTGQGPHNLTAKAFDDTGAATVSAAVVVTVK